MTSRAERKRRKAGRPRKAEAPRYPSGGVRHAPSDPNDRLKARLDADGPTCGIARAVAEKTITPDQGRALEQYRADRQAAIMVGDVMDRPSSLSRIMIRDRADQKDLPSSWAEPMDDDRRARAAERYKAGHEAIKATGDRQAVGQCALVCGGYVCTRPEALARGAEALRALYAGDRRTNAA